MHGMSFHTVSRSKHVIQSLIEREVRNSMKSMKIISLSLYPEERQCSSPTCSRILEQFESIKLDRFKFEGRTMQTFFTRLDGGQKLLLKLANVPAER